MMKSFLVPRLSAVLGILFVGVLFALSMSIPVSAQEVPTETTPLCDEVDALNYGEAGICYYEQNDEPFCFDVAATNFEQPGECTYEAVVTCEDIVATNYGAEEACVYDTSTPVTPPLTETTEESTTTPGKCEIEGHKYDETGAPLADWVIGLMKFITFDESETSESHILDEEATDATGRYCLEWNGYDGTYGIEGSYSFIYKIYEIIEEGWENVSIEFGPDHDSLVVAHDLDAEGVCTDGEVDGVPCITPGTVDFVNDGDRGAQKIVTIDVSEENGYIIADAAFHVDFYNTETDGGTGGEDEDTYKIFGFVWHDKNENDTWEKEGESIEEDLAGWTVRAVNGTDVRTTTTDENGRYEFNVPAGSWVITEDIQSEWNQTLPNEGGYTVVVPEVSTTTLTSMIRSFFIPTAIAATISEHGPFDFGVVYKGCVTNCGSSNGGGSSSGSRRSSSNGSNDNDSEPAGEVLGEATTVLPEGAPNTGRGGASNTEIVSLIALLGMIMSLGLLLRANHVK
jgi:SdrD B-like domain